MCILSANTEIIVRQTDRYIPVAIKPDFLVTTDAVIGQILAMGVGFEPSPLHVVLW